MELTKPKFDREFRDHISLRYPDDENQDYDPKHVDGKYDFKFYTMDISYFSGKLEMYFRYKEIPFQRLEPHGLEFETILWANTGSEQLPQVYDVRPTTPDNKRWLRDTTPIIEYLEQDPLIKKHSRGIIPSCEVQAYFQRLLEDYADEFLWRPAMWWRWEPEFDRFVMGHRFCWEFARKTQTRFHYPLIIRSGALSFRQWLLSCFGEDVTTAAKKQILKNQYYELLEILEEILSTQPYLFGNHPSLVDFGFSGPFFRHFSSDFSARKVMQLRAPGVYEWVGRLWNSKHSKMNSDIDTATPDCGQLPLNWDRLLSLLPDYLNYYHLNSVAYRDNKLNFNWEYKGEVFNVPMVPYRVWCRARIQKQFKETSPSAQLAIESILRGIGAWDLLWADGIIDMPPELGCEPPFAVYPPPKRTEILCYKWNEQPLLHRFLGHFVAPQLLTAAVLGAIGFIALRHWKRG